MNPRAPAWNERRTGKPTSLSECVEWPVLKGRAENTPSAPSLQRERGERLSWALAGALVAARYLAFTDEEDAPGPGAALGRGRARGPASSSVSSVSALLRLTLRARSPPRSARRRENDRRKTQREKRKANYSIVSRVANERAERALNASVTQSRHNKDTIKTQ